MGVDCYMSLGTAQALGVEYHHRFVPVDYDTLHDSLIGGWRVKSFPLVHDAADPRGFLIRYHDDCLLFVPDTGYVEQRFAGVTIAAVECNHISEKLSENIQIGNIPAVVGHRGRRNHMSLDTVISMLQANDLSKCRHIFLLHLSDANSDERKMKDEVQKATGIPVTIC